MKPLVAVITCHRFYQDRVAAIRQTWLREADGVDVRFFIGRGPRIEAPDVVNLDADDSYLGLPQKVHEVMTWAYSQGYENVLKVDDDIVLTVPRLLASDWTTYDYTGRLRGPSGHEPAPYASGLAYGLSRRAILVLVKSSPIGTAEDRWVGNTLLKAGIECHPDYRFAVVSSNRNAVSAPEGAREGNQIIAAGEFNGKQMLAEWASYKRGDLASDKITVDSIPGKLSDVCILIKTFLRDGLLDRCIRGISKELPEAKMVIVDDGYESRYKIMQYAQMRLIGHTCIWMPFDSGFGAKSNEALKYCDRKYVLIASDDFNFSPPEVRQGIEKLVAVLDQVPGMTVASGRVNNRPYEALLTEEDGVIRETAGTRNPGKTPSGQLYFPCDLTVNYSLIRREALGPGQVTWDDEVKIGGGEHGSFFVDMKRMHRRVCFVPEVSIQEQPFNPLRVNRDYPKFRARAREIARPCFAKRGIKEYHLMGGGKEICHELNGAA